MIVRIVLALTGLVALLLIGCTSGDEKDSGTTNTASSAE
jgi:hypothetical protein